MAKDYNPSRRNREAFEALAETPGNVPPQAVELEEAVLGALMLEKDSIIAVQEYVTPDAFYTEEHRTIYKAIEELSMELKPIDLYTVTERLKGKKELKKVGGASYLAQLTQKVGSAANVEFHAKIIAQKYVQRELIRSATEIQKRSYDESTDVTELIGYAEGEIFKVAEGHVKRSVQVSKDILARALMQIEEASKNTSAFNGVPSGFMAIDRVTLGWQLSDLIIIAARPSRAMAPPGVGDQTAGCGASVHRRYAGAFGLRVPLEGTPPEDTQRHQDHYHRLPAADDRQPGFEGEP